MRKPSAVALTESSLPIKIGLSACVDIFSVNVETSTRDAQLLSGLLPQETPRADLNQQS